MSKPKLMPTPWLYFFEGAGHDWWTQTGKLGPIMLDGGSLQIEVCDELLKDFFDLPKKAKKIRFVGTTRSHENYTVHVETAEDGTIIVDNVPVPLLVGTEAFAELHVPDYPHWWLEWE